MNVRGRIVVNGWHMFAVAGLALLMTVGGAASVRAQQAGIAVGAAAPGAALETLDGTATDLADYIGERPVVLEFWATWCPLCKELEPAFQAAREEYRDRVTFVSVGVPQNQSPERQQRYAESRKLGGEFVFDRDGEAIAAYSVPHTSYVVVIDGEGTVVYTGVGTDQDIVAAVSKAFPMDGMSPMDGR